MGLVLSLRKGECFYIDQRRFTLNDVSTENTAMVSGECGSLVELSDQESKALAKDVYVSMGFQPRPGTARLVFEAPRSISILRGSFIDKDPP